MSSFSEDMVIVLFPYCVPRSDIVHWNDVCVLFTFKTIVLTLVLLFVLADDSPLPSLCSYWSEHVTPNLANEP